MGRRNEMLVKARNVRVRIDAWGKKSDYLAGCTKPEILRDQSLELRKIIEDVVDMVMTVNGDTESCGA
jgi:hypothetical protein